MNSKNSQIYLKSGDTDSNNHTLHYGSQDRLAYITMENRNLLYLPISHTMEATVLFCCWRKYHQLNS